MHFEVIMNVYILLLVSLPEAFLSLIQFLLFAGKKDKLKINKPNIIRFVISIVLMLGASNYIRPAAPNVAMNMALHITAYVVIITLIYRLNVPYAILGVAFTMLIYSSIENAYLPYIVAYISKGWGNLEKQYMLYPVFALPNTICRIIIVWFLWKYEIFIVTRINKSFRKMFMYTTLILILVEYILFFLFNTYFDIMPLTHQIAFSITLVLMALGLNLLVFRLMHKVVVGLVQKGYEQYTDLEDAAKYAFNEIQKLVKEKDYNGVDMLVDKIMGNENYKITKK